MSAATTFHAEIIPLAARRRGPVPRSARTVILRAHIDGTNPPVVRQLGINDALPVAELLHTLEIAFGAPMDAPWQGDRNECIHNVLGRIGDTFTTTWGLWNIHIEAIDSYPRDTGTPQALCIGGSGDFLGHEFNTARINAQLTGDDVTAAVLAHTHPDIVDIIERSGIFDFVSLVQALGVVDAPPAGWERPLGVPQHPGRTRDAAWVLLLAAACLGDEHMTDEIVSSTMEALGWEPTSAAAARYLNPEITHHINVIATRAPIDQVVTYRQLFAKPHA